MVEYVHRFIDLWAVIVKKYPVQIISRKGKRYEIKKET